MENSKSDGNTRRPDPPLQKPKCSAGNNELDIEQQTDSKQEKDIQAVYCHPDYLTYMKSTS